MSPRHAQKKLRRERDQNSRDRAELLQQNARHRQPERAAPEGDETEDAVDPALQMVGDLGQPVRILGPEIDRHNNEAKGVDNAENNQVRGKCIQSPR